MLLSCQEELLHPGPRSELQLKSEPCKTAELKTYILFGQLDG